ncbi:hypothetical protein PR048_005086 [Dryococelus australis]|uniref:Uncharacterized protein n=1 Tax=Dryococelus australis TaxID=614101 RepID=A0ABQ9I780_9NEOP|nr:hypothetical protein PR048_005085 [Dryococelus australis]KAJ8892505.1 hypothetical protein PR048_005086 [Dryococelus australis]
MKKLSLLSVAMTMKLKIKIKHQLLSLSQFHIMTELRLYKLQLNIRNYGNGYNDAAKMVRLGSEETELVREADF